MNFVIFSYHFLPVAGAESFCTTRFASSLAAAGHCVKVVTMDWPRQVSDDVYQKLVDQRLEIIRVPLKHVARAPKWSRLRYLTHEWDSVNLANCIRVLKQALLATSKPILISRTHPMVSLIAAWQCRRLSAKWIAHLSDPIPFYGGRMKRYLMELWCKRAFRDADAISLTCENAKRFYAEHYGRIFADTKVLITPHIGEPWLSANEQFKRSDDLPLLAHTGLFYAGRGARPLLSAIAELATEGFPCQFVQVGEVDSPIENVFKNMPQVQQIDDCSPSLSAAVVEAADVLYVADVQLKGDYIPYMPSKFAYQIFTDKPMVVYTKKDSPMAQYCRRYPEAGLFFADLDSEGSLKMALESALRCVGKRVCREGLRHDFCAAVVAKQTAENIAML